MNDYELDFKTFDWLLVGRIEKIGKNKIEIFKNSNLTVEMEFDTTTLRDYYYLSFKEKWRLAHDHT